MRITVDAAEIRRLTASLRREADGAQLKKDLAKAMKEAAKPAVSGAKAKVKGLPARSRGRRPGGGLRAKVASKTYLRVFVSGPRAGARVVVTKRGMPRGFTNAARSLNAGVWSHPVYGRGSVEQRVPSGWFDDSMRGVAGAARSGIQSALAEVAERIGR